MTELRCILSLEGGFGSGGRVDECFRGGNKLTYDENLSFLAISLLNLILLDLKIHLNSVISDARKGAR